MQFSRKSFVVKEKNTLNPGRVVFTTKNHGLLTFRNGPTPALSPPSQSPPPPAHYLQYCIIPPSLLLFCVLLLVCLLKICFFTSWSHLILCRNPLVYLTITSEMRREQRLQPLWHSWRDRVFSVARLFWDRCLSQGPC